MRLFGHLAGFSVFFSIYRLHSYFITAVNGIYVCKLEHLLHNDCMQSTIYYSQPQTYTANSIYLLYSTKKIIDPRVLIEQLSSKWESICINLFFNQLIDCTINENF